MSSKTKIVVLHMKELIYTGIFAALGILFIVLLIIMFFPGDRKENKAPADSEPTAAENIYIPGVYSTSLTLGDQTLDVEVVVDSDHINSVRLVNLNESITTMYPLIEPAFESVVSQIYETQSLENISYSAENKYTTLVLLEAVQSSLQKAVITLDTEEGPLR